MRITGEKLSRALLERASQLETIPEIDFISSVVAQFDSTCLKRLPQIDEGLRRQGNWINGDSIDLNYCRPSIGRGSDICWSIVIEAGCLILRVATGDFGRATQAYVQQILAARLPVLACLCAAAIKRQKSFKVSINGAPLPIDLISQSINNYPAVRLEGDLLQFAAEISADLKHEHLPDIELWICDAIEILTPIYLCITPSLSLFHTGLTENEAEEYPEGAVSYRLHRERERNPAVIADAKANFKSFHEGRLFCEICGFDFFSVYGERGREFAEGHHKRPVSAMAPGEMTKASDICIVCSNCHSMLHRSPQITVEDLARIIDLRASERDKTGQLS